MMTDMQFTIFVIFAVIVALIIKNNRPPQAKVDGYFLNQYLANISVNSLY